MTTRAAVRQVDIARALRAVKQAGGGFRVVVDNGAIAFLPSKDAEPLVAPEDAPNEWDEACGAK